MPSSVEPSIGSAAMTGGESSSARSLSAPCIRSNPRLVLSITRLNRRTRKPRYQPRWTTRAPVSAGEMTNACSPVKSPSGSAPRQRSSRPGSATTTDGETTIGRPSGGTSSMRSLEPTCGAPDTLRMNGFQPA
jgi:hypothetical protein